ncbi:M48 family metallopeptidase [Rhodobacteraceae bacterium M382]|nr:M48 family metallopeptidase [Rhodobacteraceae bacterium M382]
MTQYHLPGNPPVPLALRRSGRARRISLRVSQLDGRVTLTVPKGVADREALEFAESKADWIRGHLAKHPGIEVLGYGSQLPIEGDMRTVVPIAGRRVVLSETTVGVPGQEPGIRLQAFLKQAARDRLAGASDRYAARLGATYSRITLRDTRSRWGSCSSQGALMYSWRLILAPPEVLDYVAAHEVAHLSEMNHSAAFWAKLESLYGDYRPARDWLRREGGALHRFQF